LMCCYSGTMEPQGDDLRDRVARPAALDGRSAGKRF
jgi:hypothetical protein